MKKKGEGCQICGWICEVDEECSCSGPQKIIQNGCSKRMEGERRREMEEVVLETGLEKR